MSECTHTDPGFGYSLDLDDGQPHCLSCGIGQSVATELNELKDAAVEYLNGVDDLCTCYQTGFSFEIVECFACQFRRLTGWDEDDAPTSQGESE